MKLTMLNEVLRSIPNRKAKVYESIPTYGPDSAPWIFGFNWGGGDKQLVLLTGKPTHTTPFSVAMCKKYMEDSPNARNCKDYRVYLDNTDPENEVIAVVTSQDGRYVSLLTKGQSDVKEELEAAFRTAIEEQWEFCENHGLI